MPANLPAEAKAKWAKYLEARTPEEKLKALQEFLSSVPKHKGTENLRAWARRKIAELKEEIEERKTRRAGRGGISFFVEKEGAAQIVMVGLPNSGKSSLLRALTNAKPEVSDVPFTTKLPVPGMLKYEDIQFQLVEAPSIIKGASRGAIWWGSRVLGLLRNADAAMLVIDLSNDPINQLDTLVDELDNAGILIKKPRGYVKIIKSKAVQGIKVITYGRLLNATANDVKKLLESYRIYNAIVKVYGDVTLDDVEKAVFENISYKPALVVLNKVDIASKDTVESVVKYLTQKLPGIDYVAVSATKRIGLDTLPQKIFRIAGIIRVYTKEPNASKPSPEPLILPQGSTVEDAIKRIREEFLKHFKYARIWGPSAKYPGERVGLNHVLMDGDVIEIRTTIKGI